MDLISLTFNKKIDKKSYSSVQRYSREAPPDDMTTQNKIKPRCVRVKIEVDLWTIFSKRVNVELRKKSYEKVDKDQL